MIIRSTLKLMISWMKKFDHVILSPSSQLSIEVERENYATRLTSILAASSIVFFSKHIEKPDNIHYMLRKWLGLKLDPGRNQPQLLDASKQKLMI